MSRSKPPPKPPGIGAISALAAVMVLVPGLLAYVALRAVGLEIGPAGLVGLFVMILGMVAYPMVLKRTGWVGPPRPPSDSSVVRPDDADDERGQR